MPTNLTGSTVASTFDQLLHVDDGPTATEKTVYSGTGVATALKVGTQSASVDNVRIDGNTISTLDTNGNLVLAPNGTGQVAIANASITGGSVAFAVMSGRAYGSFYDAGTSSQTGSTTDRTAVKVATSAVTPAGVSVVSNSRITLTAAGTYRFNASLQFHNAGGSDYDTTFWFAKNGTNIANSGALITVPKLSDGGTYLAAYETFETVAANDYIEMYWYPENTNVTLFYKAAVASNPGVTPAIPAVPPAIVVVERIA